MTRLSPGLLLLVALLGVLPFVIRLVLPDGANYYLHLVIQILIWAQIYTGWSLMGRFGLTSLGHGAFTGIGAYGTVLLWNYLGLTPWIGIPVSIAGAVALAMLIGYPSFLQKIRGHYFALLTVAMVEFVMLCIVALRDWTGGSLGTQPIRADNGISLVAFQFEADRTLAYFVALGLWLIGIVVWIRTDRSMDRFALEALGQDEDAAAAVGIDVTREKLKITAISAAMCALGGAVFAQYQMYIGPGTITGLNISLSIVFGVIAGGMGVLLGPSFGALLTQVLSEGLRMIFQGSESLNALFGSRALSLDSFLYGILLIVFIIYMPKGVIGTLVDRARRRRAPD